MCGVECSAGRFAVFDQTVGKRVLLFVYIAEIHHEK